MSKPTSIDNAQCTPVIVNWWFCNRSASSVFVGVDCSSWASAAGVCCSHGCHSRRGVVGDVVFSWVSRAVRSDSLFVCWRSCVGEPVAAAVRGRQKGQRQVDMAVVAARHGSGGGRLTVPDSVPRQTSGEVNPPLAMYGKKAKAGWDRGGSDWGSKGSCSIMSSFRLACCCCCWWWWGDGRWRCFPSISVST